MSVTLGLTIVQNSQNVANNTSNITVQAIANWTAGSYNLSGECNGSITIDGTAYSFSNIDLNPDRTTTGSGVVMTKTVNVTHATDGTKTVNCSASFYTGLSSSGTQTASATKTLTTIPRSSEFSVSNGTLNTAQTITITRKSTSYTHTLTWKSGSYSGTLLDKSTSGSVSFTPSLNLANNAPYGSSVNIEFTLTTYSGSTAIGTKTATISAAIPTSVKPTCTVAVTDPTGYSATYGGFVQGRSTMRITVTPTIAYSSPISSYNISADGKSYTASPVTTSVISAGSNFTVSATVTDGRSRTGSNTASVTVVPYSKPVISSLSVTRCDSDGTVNATGAYAKVTYSHSITSLSDKNGKTITLKYKQSSASTYTSVTLTSAYTSTNATYVFAATDNSAYDIQLVVTDNFESTTRSTSVSTAFTIIHLNGDGKGVCFGGISTDDTFSIKNLPTVVEGRAAFLQRIRTPGGRYVAHAFGTSGTSGWVQIAEIKIAGAYVNQPIQFTITQRGRTVPINLYVYFNGQNTTDPTLYAFKCTNALYTWQYALGKKSTSTWGLYVSKSEAYDNVDTIDFLMGEYLATGVSVTFTNTAISSLPTTIYYPTDTRIVATWNTGTNNPFTFTTNKPVILYSFGSNYGALLVVVIPKYNTATIVNLAKENFTVEVPSVSAGTATITVTDNNATKNRGVDVVNYI